MRETLSSRISADVPHAIKRLASHDYPGARIIRHTNPGGDTIELAEWHVCALKADCFHRRAFDASVAVRSNGTFMLYANDYDSWRCTPFGPISDLGHMPETRELTAVFGDQERRLRD